MEGKIHEEIGKLAPPWVETERKEIRYKEGSRERRKLEQLSVPFTMEEMERERELFEIVRINLRQDWTR